MVYRLVYRYVMIFHDRNFYANMKNLFKIIKTHIKVNAKNILVYMYITYPYGTYVLTHDQKIHIKL